MDSAAATPDSSLDAQRAALRLRLRSFEGPIDLLLELARAQKVSLLEISIAALADQFLDFVQHARRLDLNLAADYLLAASWLAYLKACLLVADEETVEPEPPPTAEMIRHHLHRLEMIRGLRARLWARPCLGREIFPSGAPEVLVITDRRMADPSLHDLMAAAARLEQRRWRRRRSSWVLQGDDFPLRTTQQQLKEALSGKVDWTSLDHLLSAIAPDQRRAAMVAHFLASLHLATHDRLSLRQRRRFAPLLLRWDPETAGH